MSSRDNYALADYQGVSARLTAPALLAALEAVESGYGGVFPRHASIDAITERWLCRWWIIGRDGKHLLEGAPVRLSEVTVQILGTNFGDHQFLALDAVFTASLQAQPSTGGMVFLRRFTSGPGEIVIDKRTWEVVFDLTSSG